MIDLKIFNILAKTIVIFNDSLFFNNNMDVV